MVPARALRAAARQALLRRAPQAFAAPGWRLGRSALDGQQRPCARSMVRQRWYSAAAAPRIAKAKAPQCPTCGAEFQTETAAAPGYLNAQKWRQVNQANLAKGLLPVAGAHAPGGAEIPALAGGGARRGAASADGVLLSDEEFMSAVSGIEDPALRAVAAGEMTYSDAMGQGAEPETEAGPETEAEPAPRVDAEPFDVLAAARVRRRAEQGRDRIVCQRCHTLKNHSRVERPWREDVVSDPRALRFLRFKPTALVVVVCDVFDIPGSLIPRLGEVISDRHPVVLVANKADLLPRDYHKERTLMWFRRFAQGLGVNVRSMHLVSALKNLGTRELAADIAARRRAGQDVYMVGRANVGKSELINALLRISIGGSAHRVLASHVPGTTMGLYGIPVRRFVKALVPAEGAPAQDRQASLYDTPGIFGSKSVVWHLTNEELGMAVCHKRVVPFTFILGLGQSVLLGGLGRIDLVEGPPRVYVTVFSGIRPHFTRAARADELVRRMEAGERTILQPPVGDSERLKRFPRQALALEHTFEGLHPRHATLDVVFGGIGWVAVAGRFPSAKIRVHSPLGAGVCVRPPMMPFEFKRLSPHMSAQRKTPK
ncbi:nitric oxide associated protein 1 [Coemansia javaensis]|uniref:Nitric oxide associated protein 1 n=1 Tax=Coemansia javaensis TaxID=2761396 RepID=A0A9W8LGK2_9FUNG|nr:nitric oxide associated protein 1 [Coemansia javaensis]